jgi:hypothetical protein
MGGAYAKLAALAAKIVLGALLFFKGGQGQRRKDKIKSQANKITALEAKDEIDELSDDDVVGRLSAKWLRRNDD